MPKAGSKGRQVPGAKRSTAPRWSTASPTEGPITKKKMAKAKGPAEAPTNAPDKAKAKAKAKTKAPAQDNTCTRLPAGERGFMRC